ncbi:hypothetical protein A1342_21110 [Methylomonas methanica]|uniref:Uncharacterized protein n=1 Tax=Methylomonas denitrificans TaxID=1538553 RepID=A0A126T3V0_9GAMM|nr:hypothetical protein JT25_009715 [Methylomonas denitrificans]OAH96337.1 hypothetical protein A1342_21110 [Methylomonas methanica]
MGGNEFLLLLERVGGEEILVSLARRLDLMSGLGPTAEVLFFAPPKKSTQKKGGPDAAYSLRSEAFAGG